MHHPYVLTHWASNAQRVGYQSEQGSYCSGKELPDAIAITNDVLKHQGPFISSFVLGVHPHATHSPNSRVLTARLASHWCVNICASRNQVLGINLCRTLAERHHVCLFWDHCIVFRVRPLLFHEVSPFARQSPQLHRNEPPPIPLVRFESYATSLSTTTVTTTTPRLLLLILRACVHWQTACPAASLTFGRRMACTTLHRG